MKNYTLEELQKEFGGHWVKDDPRYYDCYDHNHDYMIVAYYISSGTFHKASVSDPKLSIEEVKRLIKIRIKLKNFS